MIPYISCWNDFPILHYFQVGWVKADTKAIQAIGNHVITHNPRIMVRHQNRVKHQLIIVNATLEEDGPYMCQLNTQPMKSQVNWFWLFFCLLWLKLNSNSVYFLESKARKIQFPDWLFDCLQEGRHHTSKWSWGSKWRRRGAS